MSFNRHIINDLRIWRTTTNRKPLILRGARQVGKTTLVQLFAKEFNHFINLNLERKAYIKYFNEFDDARQLVEALLLDNNIPIADLGNTLLFIDEIQESAKAIALLRYFYEDIAELSVISAGSLLEFTLKNVQHFPVGRVQYLYLSPMNFEEFLEALNQKQALQALQNIPVSTTAHNTLLRLFHLYTNMGGMPEVIRTYAESESLSSLTPVYESIWNTYKDDVEKYGASESEKRIIRHVLNTAAFEVDHRITFQNFGASNYKSREVGEAIRKLDDAKIIQLVYPTTSLKSPIKPDFKKSPRLQFLDTGILNHILSIQSKILAIDDLADAYKGAIIPHIIFQELISLNKASYNVPHFWVRQKNQSSAEVDLVLNYQDVVIPIEIKSGKIGKLKSLIQFVEMSDHPLAIRMYAGKISIENHTTPKGKAFKLLNLPYYLGTQLPEYLKYFADLK